MFKENINDKPSENNDDISRRSVLKSMGAAGAGVGLGGAGMGKFGTRSARAVSTTATDEHGFLVIDDFEDGELSEYSFDRGSSGASVVSGTAYKGSQSLAISGTNTELISTAGLDYYPAAGDTFQYWVRATNGAKRFNVTYGVQDHDNRYYVQLDTVEDYVRLWRYESASATLLAKDGTASINENTWYRVEVEWTTGGQHTITITDESGTQLTQISATDSTWVKGGIGYDAYLATSGGTVYFDQITKETSAPSNLVIDSFEDGALSEYVFDRGESGATVTTNAAYIGSQALEISGTNTELISMYGLDYYPSAGDLFSTWVRATGGADLVNITYGVQNHLNRYYARVSFGGDRIKIYRYEDGSSVLLAKQTGLNLSEDTWYEVEIDWKEDGTHIFTLYDTNGTQISQISATDSTWSAGGIGYDAYLSNGGTVYFDYARIKSGSTILPYNQVIDDFEDGDLSEYSFDRGSSGASVVRQPTWSGSKALEISGTDTEMISTSGLDHYPAAGDVFSCWVQGASGADDLNFTYGVQNHTNRYFVRLDFLNNNLKLYRHENGSSTLLAKDISVTVAENQWYNIEVDWRKAGTHIITIYDSSKSKVAQISASDSMWEEGGIGYDAYLSGGGTVYFDSVSIHHSVLDDFEDGNINEYRGDTASFAVQNSTVIKGNQTLKGTGSPGAIAHTSIKTPRGYVYKTSAMAAIGSGAQLGLIICSQDPTSPLQDCYYLAIDPSNDTLSIYCHENGNSTLLDRESVSLMEGDQYNLTIEFTNDRILGSVEDLAGTELAGVGEKDSTYQNGYFGLYIDGGNPAYFDYVTKEKLGIEFLESFEDGDLAEYSGDTEDYLIQSSTRIEGEHSLKCVNSYTSIAHKTLQVKRGNTYSCRTIMVDTESKAGLLACVQDPDLPLDNCYWAQANSKTNQLRLIRRDNGSSVLLDEVDVEITEGNEYRLAIGLKQDKIKAFLLSRNGKDLAQTAGTKDTTYTSGTIGYHTGGSNSEAYYDTVIKQPISNRYFTEVNESSSIAQKSLDSQQAQNILNELNQPSVDLTGATKLNTFSSNGLGTYAISIPIEYGKLIVGYDQGITRFAFANLDRSSMPSSVIGDISDEFGWPTSEEAMIFDSTNQQTPKFIRSVTDSEMNDLISTVETHSGRSDRAHYGYVENNNGGEYGIGYYDKEYKVNRARDTVTSERETYGSPTCESLRSDCAGLTGLHLVGTISTAAFCSAVVALGGVPGLAACLLQYAITTVAPSMVISYFGGPCQRYEDKCM